MWERYYWGKGSLWRRGWCGLGACLDIFVFFQGCSAFSQFCTRRPPGTFQIISFFFSSSPARMLTRKFENFRNSQPDIPNCQILKCCVACCMASPGWHFFVLQCTFRAFRLCTNTDRLRRSLARTIRWLWVYLPCPMSSALPVRQSYIPRS